jgi:glycosyltransferase involved in cell wall biosynthesis
MKTDKTDIKIALFFGSDYPPVQNGPSIQHYALAKKLALNYKVYVHSCKQKKPVLDKIYNQILKFTLILRIINNNYNLVILPLWQKQSIYMYMIRFFLKKPYILLIEGSDFFDFTYPILSKKGFLYNIYANYLKYSLLSIVKGSSGVLTYLEIFQHLIKYGVDRDKFRLMPTTYDIDYLKTNVDNNLIWKKDNIMNILFFGNLEDNKGVKNLINIIPAIIKVNNNVMFHIVGRGTLFYDLIAYTKLNNISDYVKFYGYINHDDIGNYIISSDVVINPLVWCAGLGMATIEVLIMKKLLILGNANLTIKKMHEKYGCYILVEPKNESDLYEKILLVMNNKKMNELVIRNIDDFIKNELSDDYLKLKLEKIVDDSITYYKKSRKNI